MQGYLRSSSLSVSALIVDITAYSHLADRDKLQHNVDNQY